MELYKTIQGSHSHNLIDHHIGFGGGGVHT